MTQDAATETGKKNTFQEFIESGGLEDVLNEQDFVARAHMLFSIKEISFKAFSAGQKEIKADYDARIKEKEEGPATLGFVIGGGLCAALGIGLSPFSFILAGAVAICGALLGGAVIGAAFGAIATGALCEEKEKALEDAKKQHRDLVARIDNEIETMDRGLILQPVEVRTEFRAAFRHAALKQEIREKMELHKAAGYALKSGRNTPNTAAIATIAAISVTTAASRR